MIYFAALFFVLSVLAMLLAYGGGAPEALAEGAEYAAALFAVASSVSLAIAILEPPKT